LSVLDAGGFYFVAEYTLALKSGYFFFQEIFLQVVAAESIIQNVLDVDVYFFGVTLPESKYMACECFGYKTMRVQYCSMWITIQTDHHILNLSFIRMCKRMMEIYKSMLWRLANDLLGKIRQPKDFFFLIRQEEFFDVMHDIELALMG
jgi:hypothetical protein